MSLISVPLVGQFCVTYTAHSLARRCEERAALKETNGVAVDTSEDEEHREENDGGDSNDVLDMGDKSLGPPFGIVLNGHSLVSS